MLLHFEREALCRTTDLVVDSDGVENFRDAVNGEGRVNDGADDLDDFTVFAHDNKKKLEGRR